MKVATTTRSVLLRFPMGEVVERAPHGRFDAFYDEGIVFLSFYGTERPRAAFLFLVWDNSVFFSLPPSFRGRFSKTKTRQRQDKTKKEIKKRKKSFRRALSLSLSLSVKFPSRSNVLFITRTRNAIKHAHARTHAHKYIAIPMNVLLTSTASSSVLVRAGTRRPLSSSSSRGYQKFTISNRYGKEQQQQQQQQQQAAKVVANNAKKINSGMNNNNNKNMLFASGLGASIVGLLTPSAAMAISITDPVFGDIQIWQFLVLTAGYWIGIEMYLDKKYDENTTPIMPTLKKKDEDEDE